MRKNYVPERFSGILVSVTNCFSGTYIYLRGVAMNKEQIAIAKTIEQWTKLAKTGEKSKPENDALDNCYLCQYGYEVSGFRYPTHRCESCPYYKAFGFCESTGKPYRKWRSAKTYKDRRVHATAFLEQVKTLQEKDMNKEEIEHKLAQARKDRDDIAESVCQLEDMLAEAEKSKPKLRHGDYGYCGKPNIYNMYFVDGRPVRPFGISDNGGQEFIDEPIHEFKAVGNIFDDLKALSEPLEEYETGAGMKVKLTNDGDLSFSCTYVVNRNIPAFILNLRRMEATLKQKT
jgi:hypothetical protein